MDPAGRAGRGRPVLNAVLTREPVDDLVDYGRVSIAFRVERVLDVIRAGPIVELRPRQVEPWVKDYDEHEPPSTWPARFDTSRWIQLVARVDGRRVGGAVVAHDTPGLELLAGRRDLAALWDLRVDPDHRGRGLGRRLFAAAVDEARERGCARLVVETQNINEPACRFYAAQGCALVDANAFAYPALPDEVQLLWLLTFPTPTPRA